MENIKFIQTEKYRLLIDTTDGITIPKGEYFLLGNKFVNRWMGNGERYTTEKSRKIIAASPKLGNLPELPELSK